ncbi:MAG: polysaccharide biosynthesis/export family protein [Phycisphaeraceae bacterium]|nr:polysaccharide biosynthesis/export family protein [Phycisphaeraceae bacterium]
MIRIETRSWRRAIGLGTRGLRAAAWAFAAASLVGCSVAASFRDPRSKPEHAPVAARPIPAVDDVTVERGEPTDGGDGTAVVERQTLRVPSAPTGEPPADYVIGPHDVLYVNVFGKPELGSPAGAVTFGNRSLGSRVDGRGRIQLPMVGMVEVTGLTLGQAQQRLAEKYKRYITEPWVVVEVLEYSSQPVYLVGSFRQPQVIYLNRPTSLLQGIALGSGLADNAFLPGARVIRGQHVLPVDVYRLLNEGDLEQNIWLMPQDTLYVPDLSEQRVFVLGNVNQPGAVPMTQGKLTLTEAISMAGGFVKVGGLLKQVRVLRSYSPTRGELITVNLKMILDGQAPPFNLMAGDIVYLPKSKLGNWNDLMREILPTIEVLGNVVTPLAQIISASNGNNINN